MKSGRFSSRNQMRGVAWKTTGLRERQEDRPVRLQRELGAVSKLRESSLRG